jgi:hypothetical protein
MAGLIVELFLQFLARIGVPIFILAGHPLLAAGFSLKSCRPDRAKGLD